MKTTRRTFIQTAGAGLVATGLTRPAAAGRAPAIGHALPDVAVIGAGVFGAWIAHELQRAGRRVVIVDAYGPGNARSSSGGQSRVIRMGYGDQELYTRWSMRSLEMWKPALSRAGRPGLFQKSGVLWMARERDPLTVHSLETLQRLGVRHEQLDRSELSARWPQIDFSDVTWAIHEPDSGFLVAFHAVQAVVQVAQAMGAEYRCEQVIGPRTTGPRLDAVSTRSGATLSAGTFVFACGPWLPKVFPDVLEDRIFPTRQEVFYIGPRPGDDRFALGAIPVWADFGHEIYGIPDFKGRGFKIAPDRHGPPADPDDIERITSPAPLAHAREYLALRFPALKDSPVVGTEVCQYENTSNGDFLIDRHPGLENVWLVGGGSGHGFKHGPAIGEYVAARLGDGAAVETRFSLATKQRVQQRSVY